MDGTVLNTLTSFFSKASFLALQFALHLLTSLFLDLFTQLSTGNKKLFKLSYFVGHCVAAKEVYGVIFDSCRTNARALGESILEPYQAHNRDSHWRPEQLVVKREKEEENKEESDYLGSINTRLGAGPFPDAFR